jgi:tagatose 1,6-diphosphate aldolase
MDFAASDLNTSMSNLQISAGKRKGLEAVSDSRGVIAALAIDQRSALRKLFSAATGQPAGEIPLVQMEQYKEAVSRVLTPYASAILLDPEIGLTAAPLRAKNCGLLVAYEQTGYDKAVPGRLPRLLEGWSVQKLLARGANGIKTLLYYSPFSAADVNKKKHDWVERVGGECAEADVPYFLELVAYRDDMDEKGREFAAVKPQVVTGGVEEFSNPRYGVDILKVGVPVNMAYVSGIGHDVADPLYDREEAKEHFRRASAAARKPFIYLSEGVSNEVFAETLALATEAGAKFSGVLCGRATWKDGVAIFAKRGAAALDEWLHGDGTRNIQRVNAQLAGATPWFSRFQSSAGTATSG